MAQTMRQQPPQSSSPPIISADFWLVVASPHPAEAIKIQGPIALSYFFSTLKSPPKTTRKRPPHTFLPGRVSYQTTPLPTTPSFCSLLCRPNERRPSKTGAPSISHFSMVPFWCPNKEIRSSVRKPGCALGACVRLIGSRGAADDGGRGQRTEGGGFMRCKGE